MRILIIDGAFPAFVVDIIMQATKSTAYYHENPVRDRIEELVFELKCYKKDMDNLIELFDDFIDIVDWKMPSVLPMLSQVHSRKPINNPIAGRCY